MLVGISTQCKLGFRHASIIMRVARPAHSCEQKCYCQKMTDEHVFSEQLQLKPISSNRRQRNPHSGSSICARVPTTASQGQYRRTFLQAVAYFSFFGIGSGVDLFNTGKLIVAFANKVKSAEWGSAAPACGNSRYKGSCKPARFTVWGGHIGEQHRRRGA